MSNCYSGIIAIMRNLGYKGQIQTLFSKDFARECSSWNENNQFHFFDLVVQELYFKNFFMFIEILYKNLPNKIEYRAIMNYMIKKIRDMLENDEQLKVGFPHSLDLLCEMNWLHRSMFGNEDMSEINQLVRLCGQKLDMFWVDNCCRRDCTAEDMQSTNFKELLAAGMIERIGFWKCYSINSGLWLDQSNPQHYSREKWLKDILSTLLQNSEERTPDADMLVNLYQSELTTIIGAKKLTTWLKTIGVAAN